MLTPKQIAAIVKTHVESNQLLIAYSGGLDSHVLLHALALSGEFDLTAVHVNHQLSPYANSWSLHCQEICKELKIPISVEKVMLNLKAGDSVEEQARHARYTALSSHLNNNKVLLTAHTMNDQAETFFLHALRGSGVKGLSAMPALKFLNGIRHLRPLLTFTREDLSLYAEQHHLCWIEDESNANTRFDRNFLRNDIFPLLKERFPAVIENFTRSARLAAKAQAIMQEDIASAFEHLLIDRSSNSAPVSISLSALLSYPSEKQCLLLRHWFDLHAMRMPSEKQMHQIQQDVLHASDNANPFFVLGHMTLRRYRQALYLVGELSSAEDSRGDQLQQMMPDCIIRKRLPGDRIQLLGKKHTYSLKQYFQTHSIPPWERDHLWFAVKNGVIVDVIK